MLGLILAAIALVLLLVLLFIWAPLLGVLTVVLLIAGLLATRINIIIHCRDALSVTLRILFYRRQLYPEPENRVRIRAKDYTLRAVRRRAEKEEKRAGKAQRKRNKAKKNAQSSAAAHTSKKKKQNIPALLKTMIRFLPDFLARFFGHMRVRVGTIRIRVGAEDACKTALLYGTISQSVAYLWAGLERFTDLHAKQSAEISVTPDFTMQTCQAEIHLVLGMRVGAMLCVMLKTIMQYVKYKVRKDAARG